MASAGQSEQSDSLCASYAGEMQKTYTNMFAPKIFYRTYETKDYGNDPWTRYTLGVSYSLTGLWRGFLEASHLRKECQKKNLETQASLLVQQGQFIARQKSLHQQWQFLEKSLQQVNNLKKNLKFQLQNKTINLIKYHAFMRQYYRLVKDTSRVEQDYLLSQQQSQQIKLTKSQSQTQFRVSPSFLSSVDQEYQAQESKIAILKKIDVDLEWKKYSAGKDSHESKVIGINITLPLEVLGDLLFYRSHLQHLDSVAKSNLNGPTAQLRNAFSALQGELQMYKKNYQELLSITDWPAGDVAIAQVPQDPEWAELWFERVFFYSEKIFLESNIKAIAEILDYAQEQY